MIVKFEKRKAYQPYQRSRKTPKPATIAITLTNQYHGLKTNLMRPGRFKARGITA
jgi:hypothetical protein